MQCNARRSRLLADVSRSVVLATRSDGKIRELLPILAARGIHADTLSTLAVPDSPDESDIEQFATFEENAVAKARHFATLLPGRLIFADDSGLAVDALGGRPGVASKRWSKRFDLAGDAVDAANNAHLQQELRAAGALSVEQRRARYVCAMASCMATTDRWDAVAVGSCEGYILDAPRGSGGFGYDPWFWSVDLDASFGEVTREAKAEVSHRARALASLLDLLGPMIGG
jgi:XTP/dITP diphosphohydrolase